MRKPKPVISTKYGKPLNLTWTEARVLMALRNFFDQHGHMPTAKQLTHAMGWKPRGPAWRTLQMLQKKGALKINPWALPLEIL